INCNAVLFNGSFGAASGSDTVTIHDSLTGQIGLTAGLPSSKGASNFTLSSVTAAFVGTSQLDSAPNTVNITNNTNMLPPGTTALRVLASTMGNGNETVNVVGSIMEQCSLTIGSQTKGAKGRNTVNITNDTITGVGMVLDIENQAGEEGSGASGVG